MADSEKKTKRKKSSTAGGEGDGGSGKASRKESVDVEKQKVDVEKQKVDVEKPKVEVEKHKFDLGDVIAFLQPPSIPYREEDVLQEIDDRKLSELKEAFCLLDLNNDGFIDKEDLKMTYASLGRPDMPEKDIELMLSEGICNPLDFDSFVILLGYRTVELDPEETLLDALSSWDADESGLINEEQIRHDLMTWGDKFTAQEVELALEDAPIYTKGENVMIDYVEFCKKLCGLRKKK